MRDQGGSSEEILHCPSWVERGRERERREEEGERGEGGGRGGERGRGRERREGGGRERREGRGRTNSKYLRQTCTSKYLMVYRSL